MWIYWFYVFLYILLALHFWWFTPAAAKERRLLPWKKINLNSTLDLSVSQFEPIPCIHDGNCPGTDRYKCMNNQCFPKSLRGNGKCNPKTGEWVLVLDENGQQYLHCVCLFPHLVTQKIVGGDCDVDVACGPNGRLLNVFEMDECACNEGYQQSPSDKFRCIRKPTVELASEGHCDGPGETQSLDHYSDAYKLFNRDLKCHRVPCSFDVLTGRHLSSGGGLFDIRSGCICDPTLGLFPVKLDVSEKILESGHYDGCASIFAREPPQRTIDVELLTYFYVLDHPPRSFVVFKNLDEDSPFLNPVFRSGNPSVFGTASGFALEQDWKYGYSDYVLRHRNSFETRTRQAESGFFGLSVNDHKIIENHVTECRKVTETLNINYPLTKNTYALLYLYPACYVRDDDTNATPLYRDGFVSNPFHLSWEFDPELMRSNGYKLRKNKGDTFWLLDFAEPYHVREIIDKPHPSVAQLSRNSNLENYLLERSKRLNPDPLEAHVWFM